MLTLLELAQKAKDTLAIQLNLEKAFGSDPFYKELAIMVVITDTHKHGMKEGKSEVIKMIPTDAQIEAYVESLKHNYTEEEYRIFKAGTDLIINVITEHITL